MSSTIQRNSSLELLRLLAMLLILLLHADFTALGIPYRSELEEAPLLGFLKLSSEALCVVAVNVFILLSGFFGIKLRGERLVDLLFQSMFYGAIAYLLGNLLLAGEGFQLNGFIGSSIPLVNSSGWFLPAYVGLMLLSPLLERALQALSTRELGGYLLLYYTLHTIWVFGFKSMEGSDGYSTFSFIGIYLLGAYLRRTQDRWREISSWKFALAYIGISLFSSGLYMGISLATGIEFHRGLLPYAFISYASPLVISAAVCLFLAFASHHVRWSWINRLASSTLAVYLLHANDHLFRHYLSFVRELSIAPLPLFLLLLLGFILTVFALSVLIDQIRLLLWKLCLRPLYLQLRASVKSPWR